MQVGESLPAIYEVINIEEFDVLITGESFSYTKKKIGFIVKSRVLLSTIHILRKYKKCGAVACFREIEEIGRSGNVFTDSILSLLYVRKVVSYTQLFVNLLRRGEALCLERSLVICYVLRSIGFNVNLVIGRKISMNAADNFDFKCLGRVGRHCSK